MRPLTILIGILLGSSASITFSLSVVAAICALLGRSHPELAEEVPPLLAILTAFALLTAATAGSFVGQLKERPWRRWAHLATVLVLAGIGYWFWPASA